MQQTLFELNNRYIIISYTWKISYHAKNSAYNLFDQVVSDVTATHVFQNKIYVLSMAIVFQNKIYVLSMAIVKTKYMYYQWLSSLVHTF